MGLPAGQMGNSEVGHLNLGAGRVGMQDLVRISESIRTADFFRLPALVGLGEHLRRTQGTLHLVGLLGNGGVHAIDQHLLACLQLGVRLEVPRMAVHGFLDGRDTLPTSARGFVADLAAEITRIAGPKAAIASLIGRYFAMDRDHRWERTRLAYELLVRGVGAVATDPVQAVADAYNAVIKANAGNWPSTEQVADAMRKLKFRGQTRPVTMREDGQGLEDQMLGLSKMTSAYQFPIIEGLTIYPGEMVQNPVGTKSPEWVKTLKVDMLKDLRIKSF